MTESRSERPLRVLVVDDDAAVASLHEAFLDELAHFVVSGIASTGPDALAAIGAQQPDIVLLDMHLPGLSGLEVLRKVRATARRQPEVIAVTAARDLETVREARRAGVRHYLAKPFAAADLRTRLLCIEKELREAAPAGSLKQTQIDELMSPGGQPTALPKGLSQETLDAVHAALRKKGTSTAQELGAAVGLSRVSCRRYLEFLVVGGVATRQLDYGTAGRPSTRYGTAPQG